MRNLVLVLAILFSNQTLALTIGDTVPQIIGRTASGDMFSLAKQTQKPKVLNFFWVGCIPCKREIPLLAHKEKMHKNVEFYVIHAENNPATDTNYTMTDVMGFISKLPVAPKNIVLGSAKLKADMDIKGFPFSLLVSSDNKVEKILTGFNEKTVKDMNKWLDQQKKR